MSVDPFEIPTAAWQRGFDEVIKPHGHPWHPKQISILLKLLPIVLRLRSYIDRHRKAGLDPVNVLNPPQPGPNQGVPLGGIGGGSIGRGWRGDFRRWQLRPGNYNHRVVWADQFSLWVQRPEEMPRAQVLFPGSPQDGSLSAWQWELPPQGASYRALFPRAWSLYEQPLPGIRLTCRQISPVIPHNYQESSYPCAEFRWKVENTAAQDGRVSLMFSFQNSSGTLNDMAGGHSNHPFSQDGILGMRVKGVELRHAHRQQRVYPDGKVPAHREIFTDPLTFAIAAQEEPGLEVTLCSRFRANGDGEDVWNDFSANGRLEDHPDETPSAWGEAIGGAVAVSFHLAPGESREIAFSLAWDMPQVRSGTGSRYFRRYTRTYGRDGKAAPRMAMDALHLSHDWEARIHAWQKPILEDLTLPEWYKMALFNELYYIVDGGTLWVDPAEDEAPTPDPEMGRFAYLEGHEYPMYNTYDVHFSASFALAMLWPRLECALQRDFAAATLEEDPEKVKEVFSGGSMVRKRRGAVPHDMGWPNEDPWKKINGYCVHDINEWKDLNAKFVLQTYRDYVLTDDLDFVAGIWPAVTEAVSRLERYDSDGDGLIENDSFPDQTYDLWEARGASAYTGGLWLGCLRAAAALAELLKEDEQAAHYRDLLERGMAAYRSELWNGMYFNYDSSRGRGHDSIMADQLAGQWYVKTCGLEGIVEAEQEISALKMIFAMNVTFFHDGKMGAVNGMRPNGDVDRSSMQSQEVWAGTSYTLAAAMLQAGLRAEAFRTAQGVVESTYQRLGFWFQTPEAWDEKGNYRSLAYMRPLAIWAMQWALERRYL